VADNRQGVGLQLGGWPWDYKLLTVKNNLVTKIHKTPRARKKEKLKKKENFENVFLLVKLYIHITHFSPGS
jgi:hypothetical protein